MLYRWSMEEFSVRFELLKAEMADLQQGIRNYDTIRTQIQGWAVTVGLAAGGLALTANSPSAALLGVVSSVLFLAIDGHRRSAQRRLIDRVLLIEQALKGGSLKEVLSPGSGFEVPGLASHMSMGTSRGAARYFRIFKEVRRPGTWALYAALCCILLITAATARP